MRHSKPATAGVRPQQSRCAQTRAGRHCKFQVQGTADGSATGRTCKSPATAHQMAGPSRAGLRASPCRTRAPQPPCSHPAGPPQAGWCPAHPSLRAPAYCQGGCRGGHLMPQAVCHAQSREQPCLTQQCRDLLTSAWGCCCMVTPGWHGGTSGPLEGCCSHWLDLVLQHLPPAQSGAGPTRRGSCSICQPPPAVHTILLALLCPAVVHVGPVPAGSAAHILPKAILVTCWRVRPFAGRGPRPLLNRPAGRTSQRCAAAAASTG